MKFASSGTSMHACVCLKWYINARLCLPQVVHQCTSVFACMYVCTLYIRNCTERVRHMYCVENVSYTRAHTIHVWIMSPTLRDNILGSVLGTYDTCEDDLSFCFFSLDVSRTGDQISVSSHSHYVCLCACVCIYIYILISMPLYMWNICLHGCAYVCMCAPSIRVCVIQGIRHTSRDFSSVGLRHTESISERCAYLCLHFCAYM
jgi:hypothetical protein